MRSVQRQVEVGLPAPDDRITVGTLLELWYRDVLRHRVAPTAFENCRTIAERHVRPTLGRKRVAKLTPADVDALISSKLDAGLSALCSVSACGEGRHSGCDGRTATSIGTCFSCAGR